MIEILTTRVAFWLPLSLLVVSCGAPSAPSASAEPPVVREVSLKNVPFHVKSNRVTTLVEGREPDRGMENSAIALFDLNAVVAFVSLEASTKTAGTSSLSNIAASELLQSKSGTELSEESDSTTLASETTSTELDEETASTRTEEERTGLEEVESFEQLTTQGATDSTQSSRRSEGTLAEQKWYGPQGRSRLASRESFVDFMAQHMEVLRQRSTEFHDLIRQDVILKRFFELSQEELREEIDRVSEPKQEVVSLRKSISVETIVPGETFRYELVLQNTSTSPVRSVVLYDEFPIGLQFEAGTEVLEVIDAEGNSQRLDSEGSDLLGFLTPNEWEEGKIAWYVPGFVGPSEQVRLSFQATWYLERGAPSSDGVVLYEDADDSSTELAEVSASDLVFIIARPEESPHVPVSVRRSGTQGRIEGFMAASDFVPLSELDATDVERRLRETVYFSAD